MFTEVSNKIRSTLNKHKLIIKYFATGISASFIDLYLFYALREYYNVWYLYSAIIALTISFSVAFIIQKYWTFKDYSDHNIHGQFFWYLFSVGFSVVLNLLTLSLLIELLDFSHMLAQVIALALAGFAGFVLNVRNVFNDLTEHTGVVFASGIFPPDIGGPATFVRNLSEQLAHRGFDVTVVTYADSLKNGIEEKEGYDVIRILRKVPFGLRHILYTFWLFLATVNHELIYAQDVAAAGFPAMLVKRLLGKKMIIRIGGDLLWERRAESGKTKLSMDQFYRSNAHKNSLIYTIGKKVLASCDKIFVTSENLRDIYTKYYGIDTDKIELLHNPIPDVKNIIDLPAENRTRPEEKVVLFAGRFINYKNIDKLIQTFLEIYRDIAPARLVVVGDGPERVNLKKLIDERGAGHVELLDKMTHKELVELMRSADLCVSSATTEYNPNFILEALALGRKVLLNEDNGLTVKLPADFLFKDQEDFRSKIKKLLLDNLDMSSEQEKVKSIITSNSWEAMTERHVTLFRSLGMK
jgi:glycosyltransferase involved in cell wall biosynthesis/putative flippase GtrA